MKLTSSLGLVAAVPATALAAVLLVPHPANAATDGLTLVGDCPGSLVGTYQVGESAQMKVWYSPANGGTNCIKTTSSKTGDRYLYVWASIADGEQSNSDEGYYKYYAGPITLTNTAGKCLSLLSKASSDTSLQGAAHRSFNRKHCG